MLRIMGREEVLVDMFKEKGPNIVSYDLLVYLLKESVGIRQGEVRSMVGLILNTVGSVKAQG
jgi:hypothetical protein